MFSNVDSLNVWPCDLEVGDPVIKSRLIFPAKMIDDPGQI